MISDFKCWWYRGEEALAIAFLQHLDVLLNDAFEGKAKRLIPGIAEKLLPIGLAGSSVMTANPSTAHIGLLSSAALKGLGKFFKNKNTVEKIFKNLTKILEDENRQILIIIDDIDRLNAEEAIAIFRMLKSIGRLPNVLYLLVFDRILAEKMIEKFHPSEGPQFLEKIIQASFEVPYPLQIDINNAVLSCIEQICKLTNIRENKRFMNIFYDAVVPYFSTPRDVIRFKNSITVTWSAISDQINVTDFIVLEIVRLYEPKLFQNIRINKFNLCGLKSNFERLEDLSRQDTQATDPLVPYLVSVDKTRLAIVRRILKDLFPRFDGIDYGNDSQYLWNRERRVCVEAHFDTYFRSSLSDENFAMADIEELVSKADDSGFIRSKFRSAANQQRRTGGSMVPVLLDEMISQAPNIQKEKIEPLLSTLFIIHDEIDLTIDDDRGMEGPFSTTLRYHWLLQRLTNRRFSMDERTSLYMRILKNASLFWLVDFALRTKRQYLKSDPDVQGEEYFLVRIDVLDELNDRALSAIREAADNESLLVHKRLRSILYIWRILLDNDPSEICIWTDSLLDDDEALVILVKHFIGETLHLSGPNDRIGEREPHIKIREMKDIIDLDTFHLRLQHLQCAGKLENDDQKVVDLFLDLSDGGHEEQGC